MAAFAVITAALLWLMTSEPQRVWQGEPEVVVSLGDRHYQLDQDELHWLRQFSLLHFREGEESARDLVAAELEAGLDSLFAGASARLPEFGNWYYSLGGTYGRTAMALLSVVDADNPNYVAERANRILFPPELWRAQLAAVGTGTTVQLKEHNEQLRATWLRGLMERLAARQVPAPLDPVDLAPGDSRAAVIAMEDLLQQIFGHEQQSALQARLAVNSLAAAGTVAAPALMRLAVSRGAAMGAARTTSKVGARVASRSATASASAGGAAVCLPGGPLAVVCGLAAGGATWLLSDWALVNIEEAFQREQLLAALQESLDELRLTLESELLETYEQAILRFSEPVQSDIQTSFRPAGL